MSTNQPSRGKVRALLMMTAVGAAASAAILAPAPAQADPGVGCQTEKWGFLWSARRTICDGPRRADGSWTRARVVWTPAGYAPHRTYCSRYSCTSSGGYYYDESIQARETYVVFDSNVLGDEPGWLPAGTDILR
jgi:hypothetical protein